MRLQLSRCTTVLTAPKSNGLNISRRSLSSATDPLEKAKSLITSNRVVIFSKSTCPFCAKVKALFKNELKLDPPPLIFELNKEPGGPAIQAALQNISGQRTVPNVFINSQHIGGCDDTLKLNQNGELAKLLLK
jgi:glutaredoxin